MKQKKASPDQILTPAEAALRRGVSERKIRALAHEGRLPRWFDRGGTVLYLVSDVDALEIRPGPGRPKAPTVGPS